MFVSTTHRALSAYISRVELPSLLWCSRVLQILSIFSLVETGFGRNANIVKLSVLEIVYYRWN